jgi:glutathione peroxidase-family protein
VTTQNTNYPALRTLYDIYKADGFNLVAFPCNQFGGQAPGSSEEERAWAFRKFGFEFDVFVSSLIFATTAAAAAAAVAVAAVAAVAATVVC